MRRRGRDRYRPAQSRSVAVQLPSAYGPSPMEAIGKLLRYDSAQRPIGRGEPVKYVDLETGAVTWRRPLSAAPVVRDGVLVGISVAWVTCEPPVGERAIDRVSVTGTVRI